MIELDSCRIFSDVSENRAMIYNIFWNPSVSKLGEGVVHKTCIQTCNKSTRHQCYKSQSLAGHRPLSKLNKLRSNLAGVKLKSRFQNGLGIPEENRKEDDS